MTAIPDRVRQAAVAAARLPAYVYDLPGLADHARAIRETLQDVEIYYAVKANPEPPILRTLAPYVDGFEVSSGGELTHLRATLPHVPVAFGGPGKTDEELALALAAGVERIHVESPHELRRLATYDHPADLLLRANLITPLTTGASLAMSGPFGMDDVGLKECLDLLARHPRLRLRGLHAHLASGLDAPEMGTLAQAVIDHALPLLTDLAEPEINLGGGMGVDYSRPDSRFDWQSYAALLPTGGIRLRIEPGRSMTAYCGWYVTEVLDLKANHGTTYAILRGGTHHLRTPVTKGHDQPFVILPSTAHAQGHSGEVTLVGQLCTPKDVFARATPVTSVNVGDRVAFAMAGAYAWNISHHAFLMHPEPAFHYID